MVSLWLRIGDRDDYVAHGDSIESVIEALQAIGVGEVVSWREGGLDTTEYRRNNYISLYYGDQEKNFKHNLDASECRKIEKALGVEPQ